MADNEKNKNGGNIEQNLIAMTYEMKIGRRKDDKKTSISKGTASEHYEHETKEKEKTGRNIEQNSTHEMRNGNKGNNLQLLLNFCKNNFS